VSTLAARVLGRYRLLSLLGAGGMGEVYRALDTELGREVAVKVLPREFAEDPERVRRFEIEARAAAAISHPNILAIFDVGRSDGTSYLVTELLEGETLRKRIHSGGLTVATAVGYAIQAAHGLAAAHARGVLHRDLKTENLFVTTDGQVKILDFGLAKLAPPEEVLEESEDTVTGAALGTLGYMAPEVLRGQPADARSDLFSLGAVLYELVSGRGPFPGSTPAETVAHVLQSDPAPMPAEVPAVLQRIVRRCLEKRPEDRFSSAHDVALALEALHGLPARTVPAVDAGAPQPFPGLAPFTEADAAYFFGREAEVEELWRRIPARRLLAVIGPSGAGKSSFLRAGVIPAAPGGWSTLVCQPGEAPFASLARALVPAFIGDEETTGQLFRLREPEVAVEVVRKWRRRKDEALLIVDQLEELFTLNPPAIQVSFAALLGRLADEADVHVLLAMRDDFFFCCHDHPALAPVFDSVTPLGPPAGDALRRAVVTPAHKHGFGFEDDGLVDEMVAAVEGERGALPMLAFTLARLWEQRDTERKLLSRQAYERLGGVGGALAQHAEATLARIGEERLPVVREIFRNLVTAQGTRAVREWDEVLSVFDSGVNTPSSRPSGAPPPSSLASAASRGIPRSQGDRQMAACPAAGGDPSTRSPGSLAQDDRRDAAEEVLAQLVDARLLTSYEVHGEGEQPTRRVEIVHESLLAAWPRLDRWQTQDADAARLRDELRQAARTWDEHARSSDYLWIGSAYREYASWHERYPGGLSRLEEDFANAMTGHARRQRRTRRFAVAAAFMALLIALVVVAASRQQAIREARRAEAQRLLSIARHDLDNTKRPGRALAWTIASLELDDTRMGRELALHSALGSPLPRFTHGDQTLAVDFSPDGRWLASSDPKTREVLLWSADGGQPRRWPAVDGSDSNEPWLFVRFTPDPSVLMSAIVESPVARFWSVPDGRLIGTARNPFSALDSTDAARTFLNVLRMVEDPAGNWGFDLRAHDRLRRLDPRLDLAGDLSADGGTLAYSIGGSLYVEDVSGVEGSGKTRIGGHRRPIRSIRFDPRGRYVAAASADGELRLWAVGGDPGTPVRRWRTKGAFTWLQFDPSGSMLMAGHGASILVLDLDGPPDGEPLTVETQAQVEAAVDPSGRWLVASGPLGVRLWPLDHSRLTTVLLGHSATPELLVFDPEGRWLVSSSRDRTVRWWPLEPGAGRASRVLFEAPGSHPFTPYVSVSRGRVAVGWGGTSVSVVPIDGGPPLELQGWGKPILEVAIDAGGTRVATGSGRSSIFRIWNLETGEHEDLDYAQGIEPTALRFLPSGRLLTIASPAGGSGVIGLGLWDVESGRRVSLFEGMNVEWQVLHSITRDGRFILGSETDTRTLCLGDLEAGTVRRLEGLTGYLVDIDPSGSAVATWRSIVPSSPFLRISPIDAPSPHLVPHPMGARLFGLLSFSPDGRRIAQGYGDGSIHLYPVPDLTTRPLQSLPRDELIARLRTFTNLRAVRDPESETGWTVEIGPFPGWAAAPEW